MRLILHIGMPKTGSTSIQYSFTCMKSILHDQGVLFHHIEPEIDHYFSNIDAYPTIQLKSILNHAKNHYQTCILSSESLYILPQARLIHDPAYRESMAKPGYAQQYQEERIAFLEAFSKEIAGYDTEIILYLRRQDLFLDSIYRQWFRDMAQVDDDTVNFFSTYLDYYKNIKSWEQVFPQAKITVRAFENNQLFKGCAVADFAHILGIQIDERYNNIKINEKISRKATEIKRIYSTYSKNLHPRMSQFNVLNFINESLYDSDKDDFVYTPTLRREILDTYRESNTRVAKEYLQQDQLFYDPEPDKNDPWTPCEEISSEQVIKSLIYTMERFIFLRQNSDLQMLKQIDLITTSGYFNQLFYMETYLGARAMTYSPQEHYLLFGAAKGYKPHPNFDTAWYMEQHPEIALLNANPLIWHILIGQQKNYPTAPTDATSNTAPENTEHA